MLLTCDAEALPGVPPTLPGVPPWSVLTWLCLRTTVSLQAQAMTESSSANVLHSPAAKQGLATNCDCATCLCGR